LKTLTYICEEKSLFVGTDENNIYNYFMGEIIEQTNIDKGILKLAESQVKIKGNKRLFVVEDADIEVRNIENLKHSGVERRHSEPNEKLEEEVV
jgi:hypothetical protein